MKRMSLALTACAIAVCAAPGLAAEDVNLLRDTAPVLVGKAKLVTPGPPSCRSAVRIVPGGRVDYRTEAHVGKGLSRHTVKATVRLRRTEASGPP